MLDRIDIYNGVLDNPAGVSQVLAIGRAFAALPKHPRRSVLIAFVAAEEQGLLGSAYYAANPTVPAGRIAANNNYDGAKQIEGWEAVHYHQPSDEINDEWNFDGMVDDTVLGFKIGGDSGPSRPRRCPAASGSARRPPAADSAPALGKRRSTSSGAARR